MAKSKTLWQQIIKSTPATRGLVVDFIKAATSEAQSIGLERLGKKGPVLFGRRLTRPAGEELAVSMHTALITQDWIRDIDPLDELEEILSALDADPTNKKLWEELFGKVEQLR